MLYHYIKKKEAFKYFLKGNHDY